MKAHLGKLLQSPNLAAVPIIALVIAAVAIAVGLGSIALRNADKYAIERQGDVLTRALAAHAEQIGRELIPQVLWQEAAERVRAHDEAWMEDNYGPYLSEVFGINQSYVLDETNQPIYAAIDGERVPADRFDAIEPTIARWMAETRSPPEGDEAATGLIAEAKRYPDGTSVPFVVTARIDKVDGRPVAVVVSTIVPDNDFAALEGEPPYLLVAIADLDDEALSRIARNYDYADLKWGDDTSDGRVAVTLVDDLERTIGTLTFMPERPAEAFIEQLKPALAVSLGILALSVAGAIFLARRFALALASARKKGWEAGHDLLTGLPNRRQFVVELERKSEAHRASGMPLALLSVDLDRFKELNDGFGHAAGDYALRLTAERIRSAVHGSHLVARVGGDEFQVIVAGDAVAKIPAIARKIIACVSQPMHLPNGTETWIGCSIGIATANGTDVGDLVRQADLAMSAAKGRGRNRFEYFDVEMDRKLKQRMDIERELHTALRSGHLSLVYQPIFASSTRELIGAEALLRWHHPTRGDMSPAEFIPIAERTALIAEIGDFVLARACSDAGRFGTLVISVNVSALQILNFDIVDRVRSVLESSDLPPERLELELTETALVQNEDRAASTIAALRALGIGVALDDVGTGYSSLSHIRRFAFSRLKIDRSLIADIGVKAGASEIVFSIVSIGRSLGMKVTCEGIETEAQRRFLEATGCQSLQGFLLSGPVSANDLARMIEGPTIARIA